MRHEIKKRMSLGVAALASLSIMGDVGANNPPPIITSASSVALVTMDGPPSVTPCSGNPSYAMVRVTGSGPITSTDPRLNGKTFFVNAAMVDGPALGDPGIGRDDFAIRDPNNGNALVARGTAFATDRTGYSIQSFSTMRFTLAYGGGLNWSGATVFLPAPGAPPVVRIEYGLPRVPEDTGNRSVMAPRGLGPDCIAPFLKVPNWYFEDN